MSQEEYCLEKCFSFFSFFFSLSLFWCTSLQNGRGQEDAGGCFSWHLSGFLSLGGCEEEGGRGGEVGGAMGTYIYVVNDVQSEISFPCEPVSLSCRVFLLIVQILSFRQPFLLLRFFLKTYIKHLKLRLWCMKCPQKWQQTVALQKQQKRSNKIHLGEIYAVNKV